MQNQLSIDLPGALADLVNEQAFENYTIDAQNDSAKSQLSKLSVDDIFPKGVQDADMAACCLSGIWLLHNFLHQSHEISQEIQSPAGSFWHAIMHRLEGDFWNSKYWYRKVGNHPAYHAVERNWNPEFFVDQCELASGSDNNTNVQFVAVAEWKALFEYCFVNAKN